MKKGEIVDLLHVCAAFNDPVTCSQGEVLMEMKLESQDNILGPAFTSG